MSETVSSDKLAEIYIKIRDKRAELKEQFESQDNELKAQQDVLVEQMLALCQEQNADSIKTPAGTIIRKVDTRYWTTDWDSMYKFVEEHDAFPLLEKRLHQTNLKQFLDENPKLLPVGLQADRKYTVVVRRSKA
jgi:LPS O-antigen subunit length determinant protein (WzzB/FepE family)